MEYLQIKRNGKIWILSKKDLTLSLCLFHPNNTKGKLFKLCVIIFHKFHCLTFLPGIRIIDFQLDESISSKIKEIYNYQELTFSIYSNIEGITPKQTIQIVNERTILGYCQLGNSRELLSNFYHEVDFLNFLQDKGINNLPIPQFAGIVDNKALFCQSTIMTSKSRFSKVWNEKHIEFLKQLYISTAKKIPFEQTDFYNLLLKYKSISSQNISKENYHILESGINFIFNTNKNKIVQFGACHWDFTPWNMFVEKDELFVLDWEYAQYTFPPFIDFFHFFTQNCILSKGITDSKKIYSLYLKEKHRISCLIPNPDISFRYYLVAIIIFYFIEHKGFSDKDKSCQCWLNLLEILNHKK